MKRARVSCAPPPRGIVRLNVGGMLFQTTRETLSGGSGFFASLLDFEGEGSKDENGDIFIDRSGELFSVILQSLRTSLRPPQREISLWKFQLLEECKFFVADDVAARISGQTCLMDLSPNCRRIALEEAEGGARAVNVFEASLERKDVAQLQLPPLLLAPQVREGPVLFGNFYDCKAHLNVQTGGLLLSLEGDPLISKFVVIAGGAAIASLVGCDSGVPALLVCDVFVCLCCVVLWSCCHCLPICCCPPVLPACVVSSRRRRPLSCRRSGRRRADYFEQDLRHCDEGPGG